MSVGVYETQQKEFCLHGMNDDILQVISSGALHCGMPISNGWYRQIHHGSNPCSGLAVDHSPFVVPNSTPNTTETIEHVLPVFH
jgi:hypothetical protein